MLGVRGRCTRRRHCFTMEMWVALFYTALVQLVQWEPMGGKKVSAVPPTYHSGQG